MCIAQHADIARLAGALLGRAGWALVARLARSCMRNSRCHSMLRRIPPPPSGGRLKVQARALNGSPKHHMAKNAECRSRSRRRRETLSGLPRAYHRLTTGLPRAYHGLASELVASMVPSMVTEHTTSYPKATPRLPQSEGRRRNVKCRKAGQDCLEPPSSGWRSRAFPGCALRRATEFCNRKAALSVFFMEARRPVAWHEANS